MTHMSVFGGLFSDPPLISTDADPTRTDPYNKLDTIPSRYLGKGMSIGRAPKGLSADVFFSKQFLTLASEEQDGGKFWGNRKNPEARRRREVSKDKEKSISDKAFLPPSFPKESNGPGSYAGCFQDRPYEFMIAGEENDKKARRQRKKAEDEEAAKAKSCLPNVKTNRTKRGTYGFPGLLLDNPHYNENWREELERWEAATLKKEKKKMPIKEIGPPFKVPSITHRYLDELPSTGASGIYTFLPVEEKLSKRKKRLKAPAAAPVFTQPRAMIFQWSRSGEAGCFSSFPNVWVDPDVMEAEKNKKKRKKKQKPEYVPGLPKGVSGVWKPNSFPDTTVIQSCLRRFY